MDWIRIIRHLATPLGSVRRAFPPSVMQAIETAIRDGEARHRGQVRFAVESALPIHPLLAGQAATDRAREAFASLRVWDTAENNGVLVYLLLADRNVEIVADRGVHARVGTEGWETICKAMEAEFRAGHFEAGVLLGLRHITEILAREYPSTGPDTNELPDKPVVLG